MRTVGLVVLAAWAQLVLLLLALAWYAVRTGREATSDPTDPD